MNPSLSIETATQLAVFLANRPGALARVCEALAKAEINIHALATSDTVDHTVVRMVVSDPTKALMLLGEAGTLALERLGQGHDGDSVGRDRRARRAGHARPLRTNLDGRPIRRHAPEFFDLFVGERDATRGPILPTMKGADPAAPVLNSVNHDVKTR